MIVKTKKERRSEMTGGNRVSLNHNIQPYFLKKESLTNVDSLPTDLFINILLLLPVEQIYNLRLVCRKWYRLIHNHNFIHAHLQHTTTGLLIQDGNQHQHPIFLAMRQGRIVMSNLSYSFRDNVFASCDGLILEYDIKNENVLYIANPVTKQQLILPLLFHGMIGRSYYGMGYAAASMEYKVVVTYAFQDDNFYDSLDDNFQVHCAIFTIGVGNCWRHVDVLHLSDKAKKQLYGTPLINQGFMHWYRNGTHVLTLNVETEIITETPVPLVFAVATKKYCLSAGKHLSLLIPCRELSWEVWEMKLESGEWKKLPNIDMVAQLRTLKRFGYERYHSLVPVGWLSYQEVLVFDSLNPIRACIAYNVGTQAIDSFKLGSFSKLYIFKVHRNSLVWLGG